MVEHSSQDMDPQDDTLGDVCVLGAGATGIAVARYLAACDKTRVSSVTLVGGEKSRKSDDTAQLEESGVRVVLGTEQIDDEYDAPNFGIDKSAKNAPAEEAEEQPEPQPEEQPEPDDGSEPAIVEDDSEPAAPEQPKEQYVNIQNPEDDEIYEAPRKPSNHQEQMQWAIDSIEKRSKYLDEPNVISDEAVDNIVSQIKFFDDEDENK
jgi:hypothetical protein